MYVCVCMCVCMYIRTSIFFTTYPHDICICRDQHVYMSWNLVVTTYMFFTTYRYVVKICRDNQRKICPSTHMHKILQHISHDIYHLNTYSFTTYLHNIKMAIDTCTTYECQSEDSCFYMCWGTSDMSWPQNMSWLYVLRSVVRICIEIFWYVVKPYVLVICMCWLYVLKHYVLVICVDYMSWSIFFIMSWMYVVSLCLETFFSYVLTLCVENLMSYSTQC